MASVGNEARDGVALGEQGASRALRVDVYARVTKSVAVDDVPDLSALTTLDLDSDVVAEELRKHHLPGLFGLNLPDAALEALPARLALNIREQGAARSRRMESLLATFDVIQDAFSAARLDFLSFKGFHLGDRFYRAAAKRPQYDLDLLVRESDRKRAERLLRRTGFSRTARDEHSVTYRKDASEVDLHWRLRHSPGYRIDHAAVWSTRVPYVFGTRRFYTLSDEYLVALLSLSIVHDLERGCCKVKQLLDLYLVCRAVDSSFDWEAFVRRRTGENLTELCVTGLYVMLTAFEAAAELPRLDALLTRERSRIGVQGRADVFDLLSREKGDVESKLWFLDVYPGSAFEYRAWLAYHQFPGILLRVRPRWLLEVPRLALGALRNDGARRGAAKR